MLSEKQQILQLPTSLLHFFLYFNLYFPSQLLFFKPFSIAVTQTAFYCKLEFNDISAQVK